MYNICGNKVENAYIRMTFSFGVPWADCFSIRFFKTMSRKSPCYRERNPSIINSFSSRSSSLPDTSSTPIYLLGFKFFTKNANNQYKEKNNHQNQLSLDLIWWLPFAVLPKQKNRDLNLTAYEKQNWKYWLHLLKSKGVHQPLGDKILHIYTSTKQTSPRN